MSKELEMLESLFTGASRHQAEHGIKVGHAMLIQARYEHLKRILTPPTADEVCEHLNKSFNLNILNTDLHFIYDKESREFRMVSQNVLYRYISTKRQSDDSIELIDLDIDDIIILGRFYEGLENDF